MGPPSANTLFSDERDGSIVPTGVALMRSMAKGVQSVTHLLSQARAQKRAAKRMTKPSRASTLLEEEDDDEDSLEEEEEASDVD